MKTLTSVDPRPEQKSIVIQSYINTTGAGVSGFYEVVGSGDSIDKPWNLEFQCILPSNVSWIIHKRDAVFDTSPLLTEHHGPFNTTAQPQQKQNPRKKRARKTVGQHAGPLRRSERIRLQNLRKQ